MKIEVLRYSSQSQTTLSAILIDGKFECYGLEDCHRKEKIRGETRIPSGVYQVTLRKVGTHHTKYSQKFPDFHKGMLWVRDVENFEWILIHIGNSKLDTEGCLLVGQTANNNVINKGYIAGSTLAYKQLYQKVVDSAEEGTLWIEYKDLDLPPNQ
jgi:hypothetical protein